MITKEQLAILKAEKGSFVEYTFVNLFDHVKMVGAELHLKPDGNCISEQKTIDVPYTEESETKKLNP